MVRGVLFDSGGVLIRPIGGRWNPRFDFEPTVLAAAPHLGADDFARAAEVGEQFLAAAPADAPRADYHRAMLESLGVDPADELLAELEREIDPMLVVEPFPEVIGVLTELQARGTRMAVVSDNWPTLERVHAGLGIARFFDAYAISAVLGCAKPDQRMYAHASNALGLAPSECLFVDDVPELVAAAIELGYAGAAVIRDGREPDVEVPTIADLTEVLDLL